MAAEMHFEILRRIAETASGMRYQDTWYHVTFDSTVDNYRIDVYTDETQAPPDSIKCTAWKRPDVPTVSAGSITSTGPNPVIVNLMSIPVPQEELQGWTGPVQASDPTPPAEQPRSGPPMLAADAAFWSAAAVEKFLVPYYASTYGSMAPRVVAQLLNIFVPPDSPETTGNGMIDMADAAPAQIPAGMDLRPTLGDPTGGPAIANPAEYDQPFAVVHLPNSEYTAEPGSSPIFTLHQSGAVRRFRVAV